MKTKTKTKAKAYRFIKCNLCGQYLEQPLDLIVYNIEGKEAEISELEFRHQTKCDDKRFYMSRHVKEGFQDLLDRWDISSFNRKNQNKEEEADDNT